ncbi:MULTISPECIES: DUF4134 domain-containing protein [Sphingobacterium]|uniref:DUF4134 domain-containing protein n=1 Tax=Sphingobacterium litopenaei TaxID=2763500 RepID=A0ABR7YFV0_9SPHI|nr:MULTISPECIES: DUF4134 domain-containing protein [Sphingobacterium]MBD1430196.1 DUF4134 domain-containing protein [Sphingobacterium litopenaei]NGM73501.1 DUF4134 domain-containing protein [Sphingobacterium sp. SGL-16]
MQKSTCFILFYLIISLNVKTLNAQPGINEFYSLTNEVNRYYFNFSDLALAIGAICGLIGGLRIYNNWQLGKDRIDTQISGWFMSCLFLTILSSVLKGLFH